MGGRSGGVGLCKGGERVISNLLELVERVFGRWLAERSEVTGHEVDVPQDSEPYGRWSEYE